MSKNENKSDIQHMKDILRTQLSSYYQNIAVSVFDWEGMPEQTMRIPRRQPEKQLYENGCFCVAEGANMPTTLDATEFIQSKGMLFSPGKASNAGGVATSGLEMTQNAMHISWAAEEVDAKLHYIMNSIHEACVKYGTEPSGYINYVKGANIAGFMKVARAMLEQGVV